MLGELCPRDNLYRAVNEGGKCSSSFVPINFVHAEKGKKRGSKKTLLVAFARVIASSSLLAFVLD